MLSYFATILNCIYFTQCVSTIFLGLLVPSPPPAAVFSQPIISKAQAQLLKTHFLPLMEKLKKKAATVLLDEEHMKAEGRGEMSESELLILDEFTILVRDLYAFYPLLIRFVDYNR